MPNMTGSTDATGRYITLTTPGATTLSSWVTATADSQVNAYNGYAQACTQVGAQTIIAMSKSGTTVTATVGNTTGMWVGQTVTLQGVLGGQYVTYCNGVFTVTAVNYTTNTFSFTASTAPTGAYTSNSGTAVITTQIKAITAGPPAVIDLGAAGAITASATGLKIVIAQRLRTWENAWFQNCSSIPPNAATNTSVAAGYMASDGHNSMDLSPSGLNAALWFLDDTYWATASGQTRSACTFVHNGVAVQSGGNYYINYTTGGVPGTGSDTLTFYAPTAGATTPYPLFTPGNRPQDVQRFDYPVGGININPYCTIVSCFSTGLGAPYPLVNMTSCLYWINNISTAGVVTLSSALSTGGTITSLPLVSSPVAIAAGQVTLTSGSNTQTFVTTGCNAGATSLPVVSEVPNFAYPTSSTVTAVTAPVSWNMQKLDSSIGEGMPNNYNTCQWLTYTDGNGVKWVVAYGMGGSTGNYPQYSGAAASGTTASIAVSGTPWVANQWKSQNVYITSGPLAGSSAIVASNTTNSLSFVAGAFAQSVTAGTTFRITENSSAYSGRNVFAMRWKYSDLNIANGSTTPNMGNVQYYGGGWGGTRGWVTSDLLQGEGNGYSQMEAQLTEFPPYDVLLDGGSVYQKSDGSYIMTMMPVGYVPSFSGYMMPSIGGSIGGFYGQSQGFWYQANTFNLSGYYTYQCQSHVEQTWPGKGTDDVLISFDQNAGGGLTGPDNTDARSYLPVFLAVTGL